MTPDEKLDKLLANQNELFTELRVHIAQDEDQWRRVAEAEADLKDLAESNGKVKTKQAVITALLTGGGFAGLQTLMKAFL